MIFICLNCNKSTIITDLDETIENLVTLDCFSEKIWNKYSVPGERMWIRVMLIKS